MHALPRRGRDEVIDRVTFTGADDSVDPFDLVRIQQRFPFVEWGILFGSEGRQGTPRYPTDDWLRSFNNAMPEETSAHLCGRWMREIVRNGRVSWSRRYHWCDKLFSRIQLNFSAERVFDDEFRNIVRVVDILPQQVVFQCGLSNRMAVRRLLPYGAPLFDASGGRGQLPPQWEKPWSTYTGYAGGIGPDNVVEVINLLHSLGNTPMWIDMETKVRSNDDKDFDLEKVIAVCEAVAPLIPVLPVPVEGAE